MHIRAGLRFLADNQLSNGGYSADRLGDPSVKDTYSTTFVPSVMMIALRDVAGSEGIKMKISHFLLSQKSEQWTWNYWDGEDDAAKRWPYPDDLDATFVALAAISQHDPHVLTPHVLADITRILVATELKVGGPYRTWLVDNSADERWRDVDIVVNANVAYFLSLQGVNLPRLTTLFEHAIRQRDLASPYYPVLFPAAYFISRAYTGRYNSRLQEMILRAQILGTWETPHRTAMAITSLMQLGYEAQNLERAVEYLKETQRSDGSWEAGPLCRDVKRSSDGNEFYIGAETLTTALCVEALHAYDSAIQKQPLSTRFTEAPNYRGVLAKMEQTLGKIPDKELRQTTADVFKKIISSDTDGQIATLAWFTAEAVSQPIENDIAYQLSTASVWGWIAYTIYDDFLDREGDERLLPAAIFAKRQLVKTLDALLPGNEAFATEVNTILDHIDGANAWEVAACRGVVKQDVFFIEALPDYEDNLRLAQRSFGHAIAALGVLYAHGYAADDKRIVALRKFFLHYLIARQLTDDAHDWEEDLRRGHVNAVAVILLKAWQKETGRSSKDGIDLKRDLKQLRLLMWEEVIDVACEQINHHIVHAREAVSDPELAIDAKRFLQLLNPLQSAAEKALRTRDQAKEFAQAL